MRKNKTVIITENGQELKFLIKQMPAMQLARWCGQGLCLLFNSRGGASGASGLSCAGALGDPGAPSANAPEEFTTQIQRYGNFETLACAMALDMANIQPLVDELLTCCYHLSGPNSMTQLTPGVSDGIIGELPTLLKLLAEALALNLDFLWPDGTPTEDTALADPSGSQNPEVLRFNLCTEAAPKN